MTVSQPSTTTLRAVITVFAGLAIIGTAFRLWYRYHIRRLWLDDAWAAVSLVSQFALLVNLWIRTDTPAVGPLHQSRETRVVAYWMVSLCFTFTLWSARMSQLFSVIRIIPKIMAPIHTVGYILAYFYGLMWTALVVQKVYLCKRNTSWYNEAMPQCHLGKPVALTELCTDFISDAILILIPLRLLWNISMPTAQRKLLFCIFSASVLTTIASIVHAYFVLGPSGLLEAMTANIEASVSLIVANLAVIVTYLYRRLRNTQDSEDDYDYPSSSSGSKTWHFNSFRLKKCSASHVPSDGKASTIRFAAVHTMSVLESQTLDESLGAKPNRGLVVDEDAEAHSRYSSHVVIVQEADEPQDDEKDPHSIKF